MHGSAALELLQYPYFGERLSSALGLTGVKR